MSSVIVAFGHENLLFKYLFSFKFFFLIQLYVNKSLNKEELHLDYSSRTLVKSYKQDKKFFA